MPKMIQVRNVPERLHRELTRRARALDMTLTHYVQRLLEREVAKPSREELFRRVRQRRPVQLERPAAQLLREDRAERGE